MYFEGQINHFI